MLLMPLVVALALASATDDGDLRELFEAKRKIHLASLERQLDILDKFLETYYADFDFEAEDAVEYVSNPINTYMMIKRTGLEWPHVKRVLFNETVDQEYQELQQLGEKLQSK